MVGKITGGGGQAKLWTPVLVRPKTVVSVRRSDSNHKPQMGVCGAVSEGPGVPGLIHLSPPHTLVRTALALFTPPPS